ncbi:hypothetical protein ACQE3E_16100 [Methylomonas sp. MED-D]|uniref:hypothetical protein n=1 Tax=unclassified Methylomonas TaxID=2608980 RepID=UPI0028A4FA8A|nr:hypothetical protein [Methylomonas sp. MV1]MDT4331120.1 hypothetical protein [Methylomonas sp. MV1]
MKYDAKVEHSHEKHTEFTQWLIRETVSGLLKSKGNPEEIKSCVFLFLHRAYEAHFDPDEIVDLLGAKKPSIIDKAELFGADEEAVLAAYELLDPVISQMYE